LSLPKAYINSPGAPELLKGCNSTGYDAEFLVRFWLRLTYDGDGEPKEHGGEGHNGVEPSSSPKLLPLDIAGSDKERKKDTYATNWILARELQ
jgi:hypothetical protein